MYSSRENTRALPISLPLMPVRSTARDTVDRLHRRRRQTSAVVHSVLVRAMPAL